MPSDYAGNYANAHASIMRDLGRIQAEAKFRKGAGWAQAIGEIGQTIAGIPGQLADKKRQDQESQLWEANLQDFMQKRQENQWLKDAMNSSMGPAGEIDERKLSENLQLLGAADLIPRAVQVLQESKRAGLELKHAEAQGLMDEAALAQLRRAVVAPHAKALVESQGNPAVLEAALAAIRIDGGAQLADALEKEIAANPSGVKAYAESLLVPEKDKPSVSVAKDAGLWNPNTGKWDVERPAQTEPVQSLDDQLAAAFKAGDRAKINAIVKLQGEIAAGKRAPERPGAPNYQWVTLPDGTQKFMSPDEIRSTPGAAPPSASRSADAPAGVKSELASIGTLSDMLTQIETVGEANNWKGIGGFGVGAWKDFIKKHAGSGAAGEQELRNTISNVLAEIAKLRGGTAFTAQEKQLLERYTPTINESAESVIGKVKSLKTFLATKKRNIEQQFMGNSGTAPNRAGGAGPGAGSGGSFTVSAGGQTFSFPSQAALDAFKAKAGIK